MLYQMLIDTREELRGLNKKSEISIKQKDVLSSITVVLGEIQNKLKLKDHEIKLDKIGNPVDQHIQLIFKKIIDGIKYTKEKCELNKVEVPESYETELNFYSEFMPQLISSDEIVVILKEKQFNNIGQCMGFFSQNHKNKVDMKIVKELFLAL